MPGHDTTLGLPGIACFLSPQLSHSTYSSKPGSFRLYVLALLVWRVVSHLPLLSLPDLNGMVGSGPAKRARGRSDGMWRASEANNARANAKDKNPSLIAVRLGDWSATCIGPFHSARQCYLVGRKYSLSAIGFTYSYDGYGLQQD